MIKFLNIFLTSFLLGMFLPAPVLADLSSYNKCIKYADIGNFIDGEFDGVKFENIKIDQAKKVCLKANDLYPNNVKILRSLGRIFLKTKNFKEAFNYHLKSSNLGDAFSDWRLSEYYFYGEGINLDYDKAFKYIQMSKNKNFIWALEKIGEYYQYGYGTKINLDKAYQSFKKCAEFNTHWCLFKMYRTYTTGELNNKIDDEKKLIYIQKLLDIESADGYVAMGDHLLNNAKNQIDIRNAILNYEKAESYAYSNLLNLYLFQDDFPIFSKMFPNKESNKKMGIKYLNKLIDDINFDEYEVNLSLMSDFFTNINYTKVLQKSDLDYVIKRLEKISFQFTSKNSKIDVNVISDLAAIALGDYYFNGLYENKDLEKSFNYYSIAADRNNYFSAISAGWVAFQIEKYDEAFKYNNLVINNSSDPEWILYALNNNALIDDKLHGSGTDFQIKSYQKAAEIVDKYEFFVGWPYENLANTYYFPIKNAKNENSSIQNIQKAKNYNNKFLYLTKKDGVELKPEDHLFSFLLNTFEKPPKDIEEANRYLEYAALNGHTYAYYDLAWLNSGYRDKNRKKQSYKWLYICSFLSDDETKENCKTYIKKMKKTLSYFDKQEIETSAGEWIYNKEERLVTLKDELKIDIKKNVATANLDFGDYYALLIGINKYKYLQDLRTPINDVNRLEQILKEKYEFNTNKIINPSRRELLKEINKYTKSLSKNDNLIIYFAGHGEQKADEGFWLTGEARRDDDIDWISVNRIQRKLREIKANNILVVADSCFSGLLTRGLNIQKTEFKQSSINFLHKAKSRIALTSGNDEPVLNTPL